MTEDCFSAAFSSSPFLPPPLPLFLLPEVFPDLPIATTWGNLIKAVTARPSIETKTPAVVSAPSDSSVKDVRRGGVMRVCTVAVNVSARVSTDLPSNLSKLLCHAHTWVLVYRCDSLSSSLETGPLLVIPHPPP